MTWGKGILRFRPCCWKKRRRYDKRHYCNDSPPMRRYDGNCAHEALVRMSRTGMSYRPFYSFRYSMRGYGLPS